MTTTARRFVPGRTDSTDSAERPDAEPLGSRTRVVPWSVVLVPAVLMCAADTFWVVVLRSAVGSIERTQEPFRAWATGAALMLPLFVLTVLVALRLAARWVGDDPRGVGPLAAVAALTAVGGTVAGTTLRAVDAVYDGVLENRTSEMMGAMSGACTGPCVAQQHSATWGLQLRALAVCALLVLVTNLVLAVWLVCLGGGRVALARASTDRGRGWPAVVATALAGAAVIHLAVVPEHLTEWPLAGQFFVALAVAQLVAAVLFLTGRRGTRVLTLLVTVLPLWLWVWSRTVGFSFGPDPGEVEAVGTADVVSGVLEVVALMGVLLLPAGRVASKAGPSVPRHLERVLVLATVVLTVAGLSGAGIPWLDAIGVVSGSMSAPEAAGG